MDNCSNQLDKLEFVYLMLAVQSDEGFQLQQLQR